MATRHPNFELDSENHLLGYPFTKVESPTPNNFELYIDGLLAATVTYRSDHCRGGFGSRSSLSEKEALKRFWSQSGFKTHGDVIGVELTFFDEPYDMSRESGQTLNELF